MVLHVQHAIGSFGMQSDGDGDGKSNQIKRHAAFYTTTARFVAWMGRVSPTLQSAWIPTAQLSASSTWGSSPRSMLKDSHQHFVGRYNCNEDIQQLFQDPAASQDTMTGGAVAGGSGGTAVKPQP